MAKMKIIRWMCRDRITIRNFFLEENNRFRNENITEKFMQLQYKTHMLS